MHWGGLDREDVERLESSHLPSDLFALHNNPIELQTCNLQLKNTKFDTCDLRYKSDFFSRMLKGKPGSGKENFLPPDEVYMEEGVLFGRYVSGRPLLRAKAILKGGCYRVMGNPTYINVSTIGGSQMMETSFKILQLAFLGSGCGKRAQIANIYLAIFALGYHLMIALVFKNAGGGGVHCRDERVQIFNLIISLDHPYMPASINYPHPLLATLMHSKSD